LRPKPGAVSRVIGSGILTPLTQTTIAGGLNAGKQATGSPALVFPYTPTISYSQNVDYQTITTVHANQDYHIYSKTPAVELTVDGSFTVQNQQEGQYAFACMHFLRVMSKMNFGENDPNAGTPPPILLFNAYGPFVFNNLPVIVKNFSVGFPDDVDYVQVTVSSSPNQKSSTPSKNTPIDLSAQASGTQPINLIAQYAGTSGTQIPAQLAQQPGNYTVWMPSLFKIQIGLVVQHSPSDMQTKFNLPKFVNGDSSQASFI
jgi:hypothetical protein